jgi:branched-chain amino acid transport system permease protein
MVHDLVYVAVYGLIFASLYGIMTVGFSFICGLGGFYDITLPAYLMVGCFAFVEVYPYLSHLSILVVPVGLGIFCVLHYTLFIRPQRENAFRVFFATILLALGVESLMAIFRAPGYTYKIPSLLTGTLEIVGTSIRHQLILAGVIGWVALLGLLVFTSKTNVGRAIIAIPQSARGSQVIGLDVVKIQMVVYLVGGILLGLGGYFYGGYVGVSIHMWTYPLIIMFTITTLGGLGSVKGMIAATVLIGLLEVAVVTFIDPRLRAFLVLAVAIAILVYRPRGIAGVRVG